MAPAAAAAAAAAVAVARIAARGRFLSDPRSTSAIPNDVPSVSLFIYLILGIFLPFFLRVQTFVCGRLDGKRRQKGGK